jgi:DNA-binding NarL/FixJ family response regulator
VSQSSENLHLLVPSASAPAAELTTREREIATLVAGGMTNREVAQRLHVSERTVDNHVYRIFRKLGIASRDELADLL